MILKINLNSQLKNWRDFFIQVLLFIPVFLFIMFKYENTNGFIVFYIFLGIQFIFTAYLHFAYFFKNRGQQFIIEKDRIIRLKNNEKLIYTNEDIKKIVICKSANMDKWGIPFTTFECFRIAKVYLNNNTYFIMTNLLEYDIEKPLQILKGVKFEREKGISFFI